MSTFAERGAASGRARKLLNKVPEVTLAFWIIIGDWLSQPTADGGLGFGSTWTSVLFLVTIVGLVVELTVSRRDQPRARLAVQEGT